jgi:hypothetical protein
MKAMATKRLRVGTETDEESMMRGGDAYLRAIRRDLAHQLANEIERSGMLTIREEPVFDRRSVRITADIEVVDPAVSGSSPYGNSNPAAMLPGSQTIPPQAYRGPFPTIPPRNDVPLKEVKELLARMTEMKGLIREETSGQYVIGLMVDQLTALVDKFDRPAPVPRPQDPINWGPSMSQLGQAQPRGHETSFAVPTQDPVKVKAAREARKDLDRYIRAALDRAGKAPTHDEALARTRGKLLGQIKTRAT